VNNTPSATRTPLAPPSSPVGVVYLVLRFLRMLAEHSGVEPGCAMPLLTANQSRGTYRNVDIRLRAWSSLVWDMVLFADVGLESVIKLRFRADDGYRTTRELASSDELLNG